MIAENFERTYKEENIHIGYIVGNHKAVFVKTGQGGSIYGYKNKYLDIALNLNKKYGCSVFVSNCVDVQIIDGADHVFSRHTDILKKAIETICDSFV